MKKFFSLFVMLMVATMTFATDYSDVLNYTIYGYSDKINPSKVSITDEGDDLYTIVLKDVEAQPPNPVGEAVQMLTQNCRQTIHDSQKSSTFAL